MPSLDLPQSAVVALRLLIQQGKVPDILDAQLLGPAGLMTQEQPGPIRATDLGRQLLGALPKP